MPSGNVKGSVKRSRQENEDLVQDKAAGQSILPSCCAEKSVMREELVNEDLAQEKGLVVDPKIPPSSCAERSEQRSKLVNEDLVREKAAVDAQLIVKRCWQRKLRHRVGIGIPSCFEIPGFVCLFSN